MADIGTSVGKKTVALRAYIEGTDNYETIIPYVTLDSMRIAGTNAHGEPMEIDLNQLLLERFNEENRKLGLKQDTLPAGEKDNIIAFTGTAGAVSSLRRVSTIRDTIDPLTAPYNVPTEEAVIKFKDQIIMKAIGDVRSDLATKSTEINDAIGDIKTNVATNKNDIAVTNDVLQGTKNELQAVKEVTLPPMAKDIGDTKALVDEWASFILQKDSQETTGTFFNIRRRVKTLEGERLVKGDFGTEPTFLKNISYEKNGDAVRIKNVQGTVGGMDSNVLTDLVSMDGSILFDVDTTGLASSIKARVNEEWTPFKNKITANPELSAEKMINLGKVIYDKFGLIIGSDKLLESDIPDLSIGKILNLADQLNAKLSSAVYEDFISGTFNTVKSQAQNATTAVDALGANKLDRNAPLTADKCGTRTKITFDANGLVTGGEALAEADIPELPISRIQGLTDVITSINTTASNLAATVENQGTDQAGLINALRIDVDNKITARPDLSPEETVNKGKVIYNEKGIVVGSQKLVRADLPADVLDEITSMNTQLGEKALQSEYNTLAATVAGKADALTELPTGAGQGFKVSFSKYGLVTAVTDRLTVDDIPELGLDKITNGVDNLTTLLDKKASVLDFNALKERVDEKISKPATPLSGILSGFKPTVDENGLVVGFGSIATSDITGLLGVTDIVGLSTALDDKVGTDVVTAMNGTLSTKADDSRVDGLEAELTTTKGKIAAKSDINTMVKAYMYAIINGLNATTPGIADVAASNINDVTELS
jgi:hypothetical protein